MSRRRKIEIKPPNWHASTRWSRHCAPGRSLQTSTRQVYMCGHTRITNRRSEMQQGLFVILIIGWRHIETKCFSRRIRAIDCSVKRIWPKLWELHARHSTGGLRTAGWKDAPHAHFRMGNGAIRQTQSVKHWKN